MRLCGQFVPDVERIKACMSRRQAQLSPVCRVYFGGAKSASAGAASTGFRATSGLLIGARSPLLGGSTTPTSGGLYASNRHLFGASASSLAATDASVVVTGLPGAQSAFGLSDNNLPGTTGTARLRFVNAAPNVGPIDVLVNFAKKVSALPQNTGSTYSEFLEDSYQIDFVLAGTATPLLTLPGVAVTGGHTYTLYFTGTAGQFTGLLARDE